MKQITLALQNHNGTDRIFAYYDYDVRINTLIKTLPGIAYSNTNKSWHLPVDKALVKQLADKTKDVAVIDTSKLRQQLVKGKPLPNILPVSKPAIHVLSAANSSAFEKFIETLTLKQYSPSTIKTYRNEFYQLLKELKDVSADDLQIGHIRRYMYYCLEHYKISEATANSRINALKFYYEQVLGREKMFIELPRPKMPLHLPQVLGENELARLFNAITNLKHKAILFTAYSAGMRVSEVVNLELKHIDSDRMQILIKCAKGKKDRYVALSPLLLDVLRNYIRSSIAKPKKYVFESLEPAVPYSTRSAQVIFHNAKEKAGIKKDVSFHSLRHSFATHLLEKGTSVIYIKNLLGHFNIKTTERYLHVRKDQMVVISSPLDDLWSKGGINWQPSENLIAATTIKKTQ